MREFPTSKPRILGDQPQPGDGASWRQTAFLLVGLMVFCALAILGVIRVATSMEGM